MKHSIKIEYCILGQILPLISCDLEQVLDENSTSSEVSEKD